MENYQYPASYPDSGESSPRSREIEFENPTPWEEQQQQSYKAKFMCSYGGKIQPRSHDNQLSYVGGDTKIFAVDRNTKFHAFISKLSALCGDAATTTPQEVSFKYQLPGEDLDALISVSNDDDLEHMMHEYDRLYRPSSKPVRMRLFIFTNPVTPPQQQQQLQQPEPLKPPNSNNNLDFLFGLDNKPLAPPPPPPHPPLAPSQEYSSRGSAADRDPVDIQAQFQRLQISDTDQSLYRRRSEDGFSHSGGGDYYLPEKVAPSTSPAAAVPNHAGYWPDKQFSGEGFTGAGGGDQPVYVIQAPGTFYHAPMARPPAPTVTQGYYVQRMASDGYREQQQPVYGGVPQPKAAFSSAGPAQTVRPSGYADGYGVVRQAGVPDNAYAQVAYDSASGRQVYYTAPGGMVHAPPYQGVGPVVGNDTRPVGVPLGQDGKGVNKVSQGSV